MLPTKSLNFSSSQKEERNIKRKRTTMKIFQKHLTTITEFSGQNYMPGKMKESRRDHPSKKRKKPLLRERSQELKGNPEASQRTTTFQGFIPSK